MGISRTSVIAGLAALLLTRLLIAEESARDLYDQLVRLDEKRVAQLQLGQPGTVFFETGPEMEKIKERLSVLSDSGNSDAAYYLGHVYAADCNWPASDLPQINRLMAGSCRSSNVLYRRAAERGHYFAAERLAEAYRDGRGIEKSSLAAVEWFYKSGRLALENKNRDFALRMLEEMIKISPNHVLSRELGSHLYPKNLEKKKPESRKSQGM
jgi:TPR repeat protein